MCRMPYSAPSCIGMTALLMLVMQCHAWSADDTPQLTDDELGTSQQQALLMALAGDPIGHRAADHCRAGWPLLVRPHAISANTRHYGGYWVGGGVPLFGDSPHFVEGTFGWDYFGPLHK